MNKTVEVNVYDFVDGYGVDRIDYGFYVGLSLDGFTINGEEQISNDEINDVFVEFGINNFNYRQLALDNGAYVDTFESCTGAIDEYFFKNEDDAKRVAQTIKSMFDYLTNLKLIK